MDLIIVDMLPYTIVEGDAFQRLNFGNPAVQSRYHLKSEKYFRTSLMPATYENVREKVSGILNEAEWISFTTDIWTNPSKSCSLLAFTAHMIHGSKRLKVILGAMVLEDSHTGLYISEKLEEMISDFKIHNKIHLAIADNAANMVAAMRIGNFKYFGCVSHTLQLLLNDCVMKTEEIEELIKECRKIVSHFKKSEPACRYFQKYQEMFNLPKHMLKQNIVTRWNSTFLILERMLEQKQAVVLYGAERGSIEVPTVSEWTTIANLIPALHPFYEATLQICYDSSCISIVIPLVDMLRSVLQTDCDTDTETSRLKFRMLSALNSRFANIMQKELMVATFLDPRFKTKYFTANEIEVCKNTIRNFLQHTHKGNYVNETNDNVSTSSAY